jgi:lipid-binding SYLF domain-containing protein
MAQAAGIFSSMVKAGFIFGGTEGKGVMSRKDFQ